MTSRSTVFSGAASDVNDPRTRNGPDFAETDQMRKGTLSFDRTTTLRPILPPAGDEPSQRRAGCTSTGGRMDQNTGTDNFARSTPLQFKETSRN
jgi:hypothetical protein